MSADTTADAGTAEARSRRPDHHTVVVGVDAYGHNSSAVRWAADHAQRRGRPLELLLVHHSHGAWQAPPSLSAARAAQTTLNELTRELAASHPGLGVYGRVATGESVADALTRATEAAVVVVGRRDRGAAARSLLGTTSRRVATCASVPVVVVPDWWEPWAHRAGAVVVGLDPAERRHPALWFAFDEARARDADLVVVRGLEYPSGRLPQVPRPRDAAATDATASVDDDVDRVLAPLRAGYPEVRASVEERDGQPAEQLLEAASAAQLLVVGRGARSGGSPWGSVARMVMHRAALPVAVVPPPSAG